MINSIKTDGKKFDELKDIDQKYYYSNYYDVSVNKYGVKCGTSLRFWEYKGSINHMTLIYLCIFLFIYLFIYLFICVFIYLLFISIYLTLMFCYFTVT